METVRLKNIAILILLLMNLFLLLLLGYQQLQTHRSSLLAQQQLRSLYASHHLELEESTDLTSPSLPQLMLTRSSEAEDAIAAYLLGADTEGSAQGGGITQYEGSSGVIRFRAGGNFDSSGLSRPVADISGFAEEFFSRFGYEEPVSQITDGSGTLSATQYADGVPVFGCGVTMHFENNVLVQISGAHISLQDAVESSSSSLSCISALVQFLDYRNASGIVCSRVDGIRCVYMLQTTTSSMRLLPAWEIETNTYHYFVDCSTGSVSRQ